MNAKRRESRFEQMPRLIIRHLVFVGTDVPSAQLEFDSGSNLVWGASNTGKSFALEAIDFMLGGSPRLADIEQMQGYDVIWLGFTIAKDDFSLARAVAGGSFSLFRGLLKGLPTDQSPIDLRQDNQGANDDTLSGFFLERLGLSGKSIAKNQYGEQRALSFSDVVKTFMADEIAIQSKRSPIETSGSKSLERGVFRFLLSGTDDSAIVPIENPDKSRVSKVARIEVLDEMIADINAQLVTNYPKLEDYPAADSRLKKKLESIRMELDAAESSIRTLLEEKQALASGIPFAGERLDEIELHLTRFAQLEEVFQSDLVRLEALEEVGFLVSLETGRDCPLCGAPPEVQAHVQGIQDAQQMRSAAIAEMGKIEQLREDLKQTVADLKNEQSLLLAELPQQQKRLVEVEKSINKASSLSKMHRADLEDAISAKTKIRAGLTLAEQRDGLLRKRLRAEGIKPYSTKDLPNLELSGKIAQEFCDVVGEVLAAWGFSSGRTTSFDHKHYDIRIDGKIRTDNGKGVRALTHAAFKVALLIYCHRKDLPHPGLLILDTPLLTFRDPIDADEHGEGTEAQWRPARTSTKQKFFEYLHGLRDSAQVIVLENVELPENIQDLARVETFVGHSKGRPGLLSVDSSLGKQLDLLADDD